MESFFVKEEVKHLNKYKKSCDKSIENFSENLNLDFDKNEGSKGIDENKTTNYLGLNEKKTKFNVRKSSGFKDIKNFFVNSLEKRRVRKSVFLPIQIMLKQSSIDFAKKFKKNNSDFFFNNIASYFYLRKFISLLIGNTSFRKMPKFSNHQLNIINDLSFAHLEAKREKKRKVIVYF